ncbi:MAG TPA: nuclear transport factor 2 family protein [Planctomycetaceae bacterium]|jgi:hypothetical protein|nr:nuclear transport factor 2 family protein [Planctomycetaceae bacterium]
MWFTETPWPPFLICSVVAAAFFAQWYLQRQPKQLYIALVVLALGGLVIVVERLIVTESERVENNVYALAHAFESGDAARCGEFFSPHDEQDKAIVQGAARTVHIVGSIRVTDLSVQLTSAESRATSTFRASATANFNSQEIHGATRWELSWQREGGEWKIIRIRRLHFVGGGEMPLMAPQE